MRFLIASRKSDLARLQSYTVADIIKNKFPEVEIDFEFSSSFGDQNPDAPLWKMPEKGVFTEDFRQGIADGTFDMVVHSWKDLPTDLPDHSLIHTLKRADARDLLLVKKSHFKKIQSSQKLNILTSSPRRQYHLDLQLKELLPYNIQNLEFHTVRGNINTRVRKLIEGEQDALVVAKAAIDRLLSAKQPEFKETQVELQNFIDQCHWIVLPLSEFPTAAAQGALAIETNKNNEKVNSILAKLNHLETLEAVNKERDILKSFGGGCHQKIGVSISNYHFGNVTSLIGLTDQGEKLHSLELDSKKAPQTHHYWPQDKKQKLFKKNFLDIEIPKGTLFISHQDSLPENFIQDGHHIYTAGLKTWKSLAKRDIWVNGSFDGLGESTEQYLEILAEPMDQWFKLTHTDSTYDNGMKVLKTYELISNGELPDTKNIESFFWMSGSQFLEVYKHDQTIIDKNHSCGPGNTYQTLKQYISDKNITIYLNFNQWLKERN